MPGRTSWPWVLVGALLVLAFIAGRRSTTPEHLPDATERSVFRGAVLTSPYLEAPGKENADASLARARVDIASFIDARRRDDPTLRVSVYARDLDNGPWIGIDERARYLPASLTKVVVLIHTLQREEEEPGLLDSQILFPGADRMIGDDTMLDAPDSLRLRAGARYTVRDLLRRMIAYSDNHAYQLLLESSGGQGIPKMLYDLNAEQSLENGRFYFDARTVATLLRSLYNSSYLSRRHSELALRLLTESRFHDGLRRSLPAEAVVASKFGFHTAETEGRLHHELHECGIVYRPRSPYVVCVMTATDQGTPEALQEVVGEVSRILWVR
jgi:beta-lactamase class A